MQLRWGMVTTLALTPFIVTVASAFAFSYFGGWIVALFLSVLVVKDIALYVQTKDRKPMRVDRP